MKRTIFQRSPKMARSMATSNEVVPPMSASFPLRAVTVASRARAWSDSGSAAGVTSTR